MQDREVREIDSVSRLNRQEAIQLLKKETHFKNVKPVVTVPTTVDKIFHRTRQPRSQYYFTTGRKINSKKIQELEKEELAYTFPPIPPVGVPFNVFERIEKEKLKEKEKNLSVFDKPSGRTRITENFAERVYVPANEKLKIRNAKMKMVNDYASPIKGRPIKDKFSLRRYIDEVREVLHTKLKTGFLQDEVYLIDEQHQNEKNRIDELTGLFKNYYASFKEFEAQDHDEWLQIRRKADGMTQETAEMRAQLKSLMKELSQVRCSLYILEENWRNCKLCQLFLHQISPLSWQQEHPLKDKDGKEIECINDMFDRYKLDTEGSVQSLNDLIQIFLEDIAAETGPPELYFTDPWQVRLVFRDMELQHLSSLLIIEGIRKPKDIMVQGIQDVKRYYDSEIKEIEEQLEIAEQQIEQEEKRAKMLEEVAKDLLNTDLKDLVSSEATILTHVFVDHAYEECVATGETDMTTIQTLTALKLLYEDLMMKLDSLPSDIVNEAEETVQSRNALALEKAYQARRQVAVLDNLSKSMKRALDKPFVKRGKPLMWRSKPLSPVPRGMKTSEEYSPKELEYLTHFTDYCKYDDEEAVRLFFPLGT